MGIDTAGEPLESDEKFNGRGTRAYACTTGATCVSLSLEKHDCFVSFSISLLEQRVSLSRGSRGSTAIPS